jgi:8-oxo-dGTP pyrophosphatase MutT (NUDIX family)
MARPDDNENPWSILGCETVFDDPWISLILHDVRNARDKRTSYATVHFKKRGVGILPIDKSGCTYLIGQWRFPLKRYSWELPAGGGELDEAPLAAAKRELREEAGLTARQWREILKLDLSNSITDETATCFVAWDLARSMPSPDPQEVFAERRIPFTEAVDAVWRGEITEALSVATILKVHAMASRSELPAEVTQLIAGTSTL